LGLASQVIQLGPWPMLLGSTPLAGSLD